MRHYGLGTAALAAHTPEPEEFTAVVSAALHAGVSHVDTAPMYACGRAEQLLGESVLRLRQKSPDVPAPLLSTKTGRLVRPLGDQRPQNVPEDQFTRDDVRTVFDLTAAGVRTSYEESLARLGCPRTETLLLHDPDYHPQQALTEALPELVRMRAAGLTDRIGLGSNRVDFATAAVKQFDLDEVLIAGRFTLLDQSAAQLLQLCARRGVDVVIGGVFNTGLLADPQSATRVDYRPAKAAELARAHYLQTVCTAAGTSLRAAAVQYPLRHPAVSRVLWGPRHRADLEDLIACASAVVPETAWEALSAAGVYVPGVD
ncbi:aldo/keto reductase [Nesterenkonia alba]|uniref:aldo/keto reductase n=1 Tax=Nesterenkonia alba TaxID=515814 RepID=UPI0003B31D8A|nr:aldo/keto reductase [Nesterenkonia alba]